MRMKAAAGDPALPTQTSTAMITRAMPPLVRLSECSFTQAAPPTSPLPRGGVAGRNSATAGAMAAANGRRGHCLWGQRNRPNWWWQWRRRRLFGGSRIWHCSSGPKHIVDFSSSKVVENEGGKGGGMLRVCCSANLMSQSSVPSIHYDLLFCRILGEWCPTAWPRSIPSMYSASKPIFLCRVH